MLLLIDNYDSFTYNLVHYFEVLGQRVCVSYHDQISISDISQMRPDYIVISPGPGGPYEAGVSIAAVEHFCGKIPILGVCLGHQVIAQVCGASIVRAKTVMHGKASAICHNQQGIFHNLKHGFNATRYHSLVVDPGTLPGALVVTAWTENKQGELDEVMGLEHTQFPLYGVQFHPESVLTDQGHQLLDNFLKSAA